MALTDIPSQAEFQQQLNDWAQARDENGDRYMSGGDIRNVYADQNGNNQVSGRTWAEILADGNEYLFNSGTEPTDPTDYGVYNFTSASGPNNPQIGEAYYRTTNDEFKVNKTDVNGPSEFSDPVVGDVIWLGGVNFATVTAITEVSARWILLTTGGTPPEDGLLTVAFGPA